MEKYLIYLNESGKIKRNREELISKCASLVREEEFSIYESFTFVDGTGYAKTVQDEIDFVFASNEVKDGNVLSKADFINAWGFFHYLNYDISQLSGGWKKYLGLALFTNIRGQNKIYFDSCRQLSDTLIRIFIENIENTNSKNIFFFEWDAMHLSEMKIKVLYDSPKEFLMKPAVANYYDTNYE